MPNKRLQEIAQRANKATPGPWRWGDWATPDGDFEPTSHRLTLEVNPNLDQYAGCRVRDDANIKRILKVDEESNARPEDLFFISHAREDIEYLLGLVKDPGEAYVDGLVSDVCGQLDEIIFPHVGTAWMDDQESRLAFLLSYVENMRSVIHMLQQDLVVARQLAKSSRGAYNATEGGENEQEHSDNHRDRAGHHHHGHLSASDG